MENTNQQQTLTAQEQRIKSLHDAIVETMNKVADEHKGLLMAEVVHTLLGLATMMNADFIKMTMQMAGQAPDGSPAPAPAEEASAPQAEAEMQATEPQP